MLVEDWSTDLDAKATADRFPIRLSMNHVDVVLLSLIATCISRLDVSEIVPLLWSLTHPLAPDSLGHLPLIKKVV